MKSEFSMNLKLSVGLVLLILVVNAFAFVPPPLKKNDDDSSESSEDSTEVKVKAEWETKCKFVIKNVLGIFKNWTRDYPEKEDVFVDSLYSTIKSMHVQKIQKWKEWKKNQDEEDDSDVWKKFANAFKGLGKGGKKLLEKISGKNGKGGKKKKQNQQYKPSNDNFDFLEDLNKNLYEMAGEVVAID
ncbi:uncharacterized protein LOC106071896 isoform X1 [Biomphalaria glabrata]|uniref:Uncharacterized protein LOC106071896 isoform X1 n=2 Tax=Biomphalaria glabrata TaxID=6526 RepID=A0A9W2Z7P5_BIOGL|nr:uncharacterized protein LOC106071896 isoform X1 [Biomphalaria glabrata]